jgi:hypothetical protein
LALSNGLNCYANFIFYGLASNKRVPTVLYLYMKHNSSCAHCINSVLLTE